MFTYLDYSDIYETRGRVNSVVYFIFKYIIHTYKYIIHSYIN